MNKQNVAILILSLITFIFFVAVCILSVTLVVQNNKYTLQLENSYQKNLYELVDNMEAVNVEMSKIVATNSSAIQKDILQGIYVSCLGAVTNINSLPIQNEKLTKINKNINTIGGYVVSLINDLNNGKNLTDKQMQDLADLFDESNQIVYDLNNFITNLSADYSILDNVDFKDQESSSFDAGFINLDNPSSKVPSLIYDGPFSDSVVNKEVKGLGEPIEKEYADIIIEKLLNYYENYVCQYNGLGGGKIQTYNYTLTKDNNEIYVQITKNGGQIISIIGGNFTSEGENLSKENVKSLAFEIIQKFGFENMNEVWSQDTKNEYYINFAPVVNKVIYYPDLVKIKIDKNSGVVVGLEATNYAYNHIDREGFQSKFGIIEGENLLNSQLNVKERNYSIIPNEYVGESFAYEYICEWKDYTYYIYLDANTGEEMNIMRVVQTSNGNLLF